MKAARAIAVVLILALLLVGCKGHETGGEIFRWEEGMGVLMITDGEHWYMPYGPTENSARGKYLGHMEDNPNDKIYTYKEYPREEWLVSFLYTGLMDNSMLYREMSVYQTPEELEKMETSFREEVKEGLFSLALFWPPAVVAFVYIVAIADSSRWR